MDWTFAEGELDRDDVRALLAQHFAEMRAGSPPSACHVLPVDGLRDPAIRFFTLRECRRMFAETGYVIEKIVSVRDPRVQLDGAFGAPVTIMDKAFSLHDVDAQTATELATLQFLFVLGRPTPEVAA